MGTASGVASKVVAGSLSLNIPADVTAGSLSIVAVYPASTNALLRWNVGSPSKNLLVSLSTDNTSIIHIENMNNRYQFDSLLGVTLHADGKLNLISPYKWCDIANIVVSNFNFIIIFIFIFIIYLVVLFLFSFADIVLLFSLLFIYQSLSDIGMYQSITLPWALQAV